MLYRCLNPKNSDYKRWGGRGIVVCARWRESFDAFLADVGMRPGPDYSLDRNDNNGPYEPGNVRWATKREQTRNMRSNRWLEVGGERKLLSDVAREMSVRPSTLWHRLRRGEPLEI